MPVQFKTSIFIEHNQVRTKAGAFDVSHMGQIHIHGRDRVKFIESFCTGDVKEVKPHHCLYSLIPNKTGTFSPTLKIPIAMGYVPTKNRGNRVGNEYYAMIRNRPVKCRVTKLPFVKNNYYRV